MGRFYFPNASIGFWFYVDRIVTNIPHLSVFVEWYNPTVIIYGQNWSRIFVQSFYIQMSFISVVDSIVCGQKKTAEKIPHEDAFYYKQPDFVC